MHSSSRTPRTYIHVHPHEPVSVSMSVCGGRKEGEGKGKEGNTFDLLVPAALHVSVEATTRVPLLFEEFATLQEPHLFLFKTKDERPGEGKGATES